MRLASPPKLKHMSNISESSGSVVAIPTIPVKVPGQGGVNLTVTYCHGWSFSAVRVAPETTLKALLGLLAMRQAVLSHKAFVRSPISMI